MISSTNKNSNFNIGSLSRLFDLILDLQIYIAMWISDYSHMDHNFDRLRVFEAFMLGKHSGVRACGAFA